jgi:hypothetical protein
MWSGPVTTQDLDRLVTKTNLTPASKRALKNVRKYALSGRVGDPEVGQSEWSVGIDDLNGNGYRVTFSFKKST